MAFAKPRKPLRPTFGNGSLAKLSPRMWFPLSTVVLQAARMGFRSSPLLVCQLRFATGVA